MTTVKVLLKRGVYYYDELPDGTFTKNPVPHPAGKIISVRPKDAPELVNQGKAEYIRETPIAAPVKEEAPAVPPVKKAYESAREEKKR